MGNGLAHDPQEQLGQAEAIRRGVVLQALQSRWQVHLGDQPGDQPHHRAQRIPHPVLVLGPVGVVPVKVGIAGAVQLLGLGHAAGLGQIAGAALDAPSPSRRRPSSATLRCERRSLGWWIEQALRQTSDAAGAGGLSLDREPLGDEVAGGVVHVVVALLGVFVRLALVGVRLPLQALG